MTDLIGVCDSVQYVDLSVAYDPEGLERDEDLSGPPVRYYFGL